MSKHLFASFAIALSFCGCAHDRAAEVKIVRGEIPPVEQNDERVASTVGLVDRNRNVFCTGVIIAPQVVLTAGHCFASANRWSRFEVAFGRDLTRRSPNVYVPVQNWVVHPDLNITSDSITWDLALVRIPGIPNEADYRPANRYRGTLNRGDRVAIAGYGDTAWEAGDSGVLRQQWTLVARLPGDEGTGPSDFVLNSGDGVDTCYRDSGGPVFVQRGADFEVAGITSWGKGCGQEGHYSLISLFDDWLDEAMVQINALPPFAEEASH